MSRHILLGIHLFALICYLLAAKFGNGICHRIIYAKFNLKTYYPSPYEQEIWNYEKGNIENIRKVIDQFPWVISFTNTHFNDKVNLFNKTIKNIMLNYHIPHKTITCDDKDPPWINKDIKIYVMTKNRVTSQIIKVKSMHSLFINANVGC